MPKRRWGYSDSRLNLLDYRIFRVFRFPAGRLSAPLQSAPCGPQAKVASKPLSQGLSVNSTSSPSARLRKPVIFNTLYTQRNTNNNKSSSQCWLNRNLTMLYVIQCKEFGNAHKIVKKKKSPQIVGLGRNANKVLTNCKHTHATSVLTLSTKFCSICHRLADI